MQCTPTTDYELIHTILTTPSLFEITHGQSIHANEFVVDTKEDYLLFHDDKEVFGCVQIRAVSKVLLEVHIAILPCHWGSDIGQKAAEAGHEWAVNEGFYTVMTTVPANCIHMLKFLKKIDYQPCGLIKNGVIYNKHLVSLILFEHDLKVI